MLQFHVIWFHMIFDLALKRQAFISDAMSLNFSLIHLIYFWLVESSTILLSWTQNEKTFTSHFDVQL